MTFDVVAEIDVPHRPDLDPVRRQVAELAPLTDHVLAPDNPDGPRGGLGDRGHGGGAAGRRDR